MLDPLKIWKRHSIGVLHLLFLPFLFLEQQSLYPQVQLQTFLKSGWNTGWGNRLSPLEGVPLRLRLLQRSSVPVISRRCRWRSFLLRCNRQRFPVKIYKSTVSQRIKCTYIKIKISRQFVFQLNKNCNCWSRDSHFYYGQVK